MMTVSSVSYGAAIFCRWSSSWLAIAIRRARCVGSTCGFKAHQENLKADAHPRDLFTACCQLSLSASKMRDTFVDLMRPLSLNIEETMMRSR